MTDVFTPEKRSEIMSRVRSSGNRSTELAFVGILRAEKITGWRRNFKLFGRPDFVFPRAGVAVFLDGCFWHGCPRHCRIPKARRKYWREKIARNRRRDRAVSRALRAGGWRVMRVWECRLKSPAAALRRLRKMLETG